MKILQFPSYITINNLKNFSRNITGYGYMCIDIAISIASSGVDTDLITYGNITKGFKYKKVNIKHTVVILKKINFIQII